jgi:hypothetical protein
MNRRLFFFCFLSALILLWSTGVLAAAFTLAPPRIEITLRPGAVENVMLTVLTSIGEEPEERAFFRFYIVDFGVSPAGEVEFSEPGNLKRSASQWMDLEFREFDVRPGEKKTVGLTIKVPGVPSGGYYAAIVLEQLPVAGIVKRKPIIHTVRMVSLVEITVQGRGRLRQDVVISGVDVGRIGKQEGVGFTATVENRGNVHLKGKGELLVKSRRGGLITTLPLEAGRGFVLPDASRDFTAVLDRTLPSGNYMAEAVIKYGMRGKAVARVPFSVSKGRLVPAGDLDAERQVKLLVDPYWVDIVARPGAFRTVPILIENEDNSPIHVSGGARDVTFDIDGRLVVSEGVDGKWSCADWVDIEPAEFDLAPGARRRVIAKVAIPKDVVGGRSAQVDFTASMRKSEGAEPILTSSGTTLILTIQGELDLHGELTGMRATESKTTAGMDFSAVFKNNGNVPVAPKGKLVITSMDGSGGQKASGTGAQQQAQVMGEIELSEIMGVVLPEGTRRVKAAYPAMLEPGKYSAEMIITYGGKSPARAEREFVVK